MMHPARISALFLAFAVAARAGEAPTAKPATSSGTATAAPASTSEAHVSVHHASSVDTGFFLADLFLNVAQLGLEIAILNDQAEHHEQKLADPVEDSFGQGYERRVRSWDAPARREHDARQGLMFSFGIGGGSLRYSNPNFGRRHGAVDLDFRLGYGFGDRFQLFGDIGVDAASLGDGTELSSWTATIRGQTVLIGDREGNGLNLNAGIGLGGLTQSYQGYGYGDSTSSEAGLALVAGLSYDARVSRSFAISPELFYAWHEVPNRTGLAADVANTFGLRLNFLWYLY